MKKQKALLKGTVLTEVGLETCGWPPDVSSDIPSTWLDHTGGGTSVVTHLSGTHKVLWVPSIASEVFSHNKADMHCAGKVGVLLYFTESWLTSLE